MKQTSGVRVRPKTTSRTVTVTDEGLCEQRVFLVCWDESDGRRLSDTAVDCIWPCDWWTRGWLVGLRCLTTIRRDPDTVGLRQSYWRYTAGVLPIRMPANLRSVRLASVKTSHELIMESRCLLSTEKKQCFVGSCCLCDFWLETVGHLNSFHFLDWSFVSGIATYNYRHQGVNYRGY